MISRRLHRLGLDRASPTVVAGCWAILTACVQVEMMATERADVRVGAAVTRMLAPLWRLPVQAIQPVAPQIPPSSRSPAGGNASPAVAAATTDPGTAIDPALADLLGMKVDVCYRSARLSEVLADLQERIGLQSALPDAIDRSSRVSLEAKQITVKQVVEQAAAANALELDYCGGKIAFWQAADGQLLSALDQRCHSGDTEVRCEAMYDLGQLGDRRIYPDLISGLSDPQDAVASAALAALSGHRRSLSLGADAATWVGPLLKILSQRSSIACAPTLIQLLGTSADARAVDQLIALLNDPDVDVASSAAYALASTGDPRGIDPLLELLKTNTRLEESDSAVMLRDAAEAALGMTRDPRAADALIALLQGKDSDYLFAARFLQISAAFALANSRDHRGLSSIYKLTQSTQEQSVRHSSVLALGLTHDPEAISCLITLFRGWDGRSRSNAVIAFGSLHLPLASQRLIPMLSEHKKEIRFSSACALARLGDAHAVDPLLSFLTDDDEQVRFDAACALAMLHDARSVAALLPFMKASGANVQGRAASALGELRDPAALTPLMTLLKDPDASNRANAACALGAMRDPAARDPLAGLHSDPDEHVRSRAAAALAQLGDAHAIDALIPFLADAAAPVRSSAIFAIGSIHDPRIPELLFPLLQDPEADVRSDAACILGSTRNPRLVLKLIALLSDQGAAVRASAASALSRLQDPRAADALIAALKDPDASVRSEAAAALGRTRDPRAADALIALLKDAKAPVRQLAASLLGDHFLDFVQVRPALDAAKSKG